MINLAPEIFVFMLPEGARLPFAAQLSCTRSLLFGLLKPKPGGPGDRTSTRFLLVEGISQVKVPRAVGTIISGCIVVGEVGVTKTTHMRHKTLFAQLSRTQSKCFENLRSSRAHAHLVAS